MSRSRRLASLITAAVALLTLAPAVAGAVDLPLAVTSDAGGYPEVRLVVAAPAEAGDGALTAANFRVVEGGQPQAVRVDALPVDQLKVALVLDTSGSMAGAPLAAAKAAAQSFLSQLPPAVPVSVVGFGATAAVVSPLSSNRAAQQSAVAGLAASGRTALYDAVRAGLAQLPAAPGVRRAIVLLSDGGDTASVGTLDATAAAVAGVPVFAVELRTGESNPAALDRLATASGGRVVPAGDPATLGWAFDAIAKQIVRQYALTYRSSANGTTDVAVTLTTASVTATGRVRLEAPAIAAGPAASPTAGPESPATANRLGSWAFVTGVVLWSIALLGLLLGAAWRWTPRARGVALRRRGAGLSDAVERVETMGDSLLRSRGGTARLAAALDTAGLEIRVGELLMGVAAVDLLALGVAWALGTLWAGLALALLVPALAWAAVSVLATRRRGRFADQLADTLQMLAGSLRAGHGLAQAIDTVARESESPTAEEFRRLTVETRLGRDFIEALAALRDRIGNEDFEWVVQAVEIQREVGGNLAEVLDNVTGTIRDRTRVRRQVSALSAEGRLSAWVLMILPFALAGVMALTNRGYLSPLFRSGSGVALLGAGGVLMVIGGFWLRRIVKPTF